MLDEWWFKQNQFSHTEWYWSKLVMQYNSN